MKRRTFLQWLGCSPALMLIGSGGCTTSASDVPVTRSTTEQVIVIGAGVAGLTVARSLHNAGVDVTVIEARDRIGGRLWTTDVAGVPVDIGGAWIHGDEDNPVADYARQIGLTFRENEQDVEAWFDASVGHRSSDDLAALISDIEGFIAASEQLRDALGDVSIEAAIDAWIEAEGLSGERSERARFALQQAYENDYAGPIGEASLGLFNEEGDFGDTDYLIDGGYGALVEALARDLKVDLNTPVRAIRQRGEALIVETDLGERVADSVICTVPLGVLQANTIEFEPALPATKTAALQKFSMGRLEKVILRFSERTWTDTFGCVLLYSGDDALSMPVFQDFTDFAGEPLIVGFSCGAASWRQLAMSSDSALVDQAVAALQASVGLDPSTLIGSHVTRWGEDPWSLGAYSYPHPGASFDDLDVLAEPEMDGRLLFAGEATAGIHFQTVQGAMLSGLREARRFGVDSELLGL